jgi:cell division protein FtsA
MLDKIRALKERLPKPNMTAKSGQHLVALDIGTENVKALICRVEDSGATVVGVGRAHQSLADMQAGAVADIGGVVANCDVALTEAEKTANVSARSAVIGIAGELVKGTTTTVAVKRRDATKPIDLDELDRIIKLVQDRAQQRAKRQLNLELGGKDVDIKLVNSALVNIDIDGLSVTNPINFQGKLITMQLYTAFAPLVHIGALERVAHDLDLELLAVAAEPFAVARSVTGNANTNTSAILIDIGGGTTDIAVLNDGGVEGTKMFGIGGRAFTKGIARGLDVDYETAEQYKLALSTNHPPKNKTLIEAAIQKTLDVWLSGVELALSEFDKLDHLPNRMLLCGGGASLELLVSTLEQTTWYHSLPFTKKPTVQHIQPDEVVGIIDKTDTLHDHTFITAMGLARVGLDCVGKVDAPNSTIRDRINKLLSV